MGERRAGVRQGLQRWAWAWIATGLAVMAGAGLRSARWQNAWLEPVPACVSSGECSLDDIGPALRGLWWWTGTGAVLVLVGLVLVTWRLGSVRRRHPGEGTTTHALVSGIAAAFLSLPLLPLVLVAAFIGPHAVVAAAAVLWIVQAEVVAGVDGRYGAPHVPPRRAWAIALGASALAMVVLLGAVRAGLTLEWWGLFPLLDGAAVALVVAAARQAAGDPPAGFRAPVAPPPPVTARGRAVVVVLLVLSALAVLNGLQTLAGPAWPQAAVVPPAPDPEPVLPPVEPPLPVPEPAPVPEPPPPVVEASVPCAPEGLSFAVPAFDAAMGVRASSVQATNTGPAPCWVEGTPVVTLLQGGRPLALTVEPGQTPSGEPAPVQRVALAPGGSAVAFLTWRTYAGWADAETPQTVTVALDGASPAQEVLVTTDFGPAPFDIADGGSWTVAPWAPPPWED